MHHTYAEILIPYQAYGWIALAVALVATPIAMRVARVLGVMDYPDQKLKPHARPIPYLGGLAIALAWAAAIVIAMIGGAADVAHTLPIVLGGFGVAVLGLVDDVRHVPPKVRLAISAAIVAGVILRTGAGMQMVDVTLRFVGVVAPVWLTHTLSLLIGMFIVLGAMNSTNLIDGLDGLCSGVTAIISLGFFLIAAHLATWTVHPSGSRLIVAIALAGAALGFLPYNFNPARIFMGDAGSMLLGFNCGILILLFAESVSTRWMVGALMIFMLPVSDTALAMFRRWRSGRSIFEGDRSHFYDQLVQRGLSVRQTVIVCYTLTLLFAGLGLLSIVEGASGRLLRLLYLAPLYMLVGVAVAVAAWKARLTHPEEPRSRPDELQTGGPTST